MKTGVVIATIIGLTASASLAQEIGTKAAQPGALTLQYKIVFSFANLARAQNLQEMIALMKRAKAAGYNTFFISDTKIAKFQLQDKTYIANLGKFRQACTDEGMRLMINTCEMGYSSDFLATDPNLAEGHPVRNTTFIVKDGKLVPCDDALQLVNGSLEKWKDNTPLGWNVDAPGVISFKDDAVQCNGQPSLRQDHSAAKPGPARMWQKIKVQPWHYYHLTAQVKTDQCTSKDFRLFALGGAATGGLALNWQPPSIKETMDWTRLDATFCSMHYTEVSIYVGSWSRTGGKIWWGDLTIEPGGFVNVIRRDSLPLTVTSEDGQTSFIEGKDLSPIKDPKCGNDPHPGYFTDWHGAPVVTIPQGSRLSSGQKVRVSYHVAMSVGKTHQTNCCFSEPKVYEMIGQQVPWIKQHGKPDIYMLGYDEVRDCGWDDSCARRKLTCGQILADSVRKCTDIVRQTDPGKPIMTWNDMFDPFHNARKEGGNRYLARTSWYGSWDGLPADVIVLNWRQNNSDSLKFFADRGNPQVLAGYYDHDPRRIVEWLGMAAKVKGVQGVMYTTWKRDFSKLEEFMRNVKEFEAGQGKKAH